MPQSLLEPLAATVRRTPHKVAVVDHAGRLTYAQLADQVERFAAALRAHGVQRGDRVAVYLPNVSLAVVAMYGTLRAGAVFMPINPLTRTKKLGVLLADAGATALVTNQQLSRTWGPVLTSAAALRFVVVTAQTVPVTPASVPVIALDEFLQTGGNLATEEVGDSELASLIYTSGCTGEPKGVMLTHRNMLTVAESVTTYLGLVESDVVYCALPLSFSYGICQLTSGFPVGATVVLDLSFAFPVTSLALMAAERVTTFAGVPTMYAMLLGLPNLASYDVSALRLLTNAADALPVPVLDNLRKAFPRARLYSMYGLTECQRVSYLPPEELDHRSASVGRGMPNQEVWLADDQGRRLPLGETGELVVRGKHVMRGYWNKPQQTAERLRPGPDPGEMVLHTGDIFRTDADGFLYFVGRKDDIIKSRGEKVSPREIESAIHALPNVVGVAVIGVPDPVLGQAIKAFVVLRPGTTSTERDVIQHCRERLESYMVPRQVVFIDALPTTATGKVRRADLRGTDDDQ